MNAGGQARLLRNLELLYRGADTTAESPLLAHET
jgi:hypothetical protein